MMKQPAVPIASKALESSEFDEAIFDLIVRIEDKHSQTAAGLVRDFQNIEKTLIAAGDSLSKELSRINAHPWRPLKKYIVRFILQSFLLFKKILPKRIKRKANRILNKNSSLYTIGRWESIKNQTRGGGLPLYKSIVKDKKTITTVKRFSHHAILAFAVLILPLFPRKAKRLLRRVQKNSPYRFCADKNLTSIEFPFAKDHSARQFNGPRLARRILVADFLIPDPDKSTAQNATFGMLRNLCTLGFEVTFLPYDMEDISPYRQNLEDLGISVITRSLRHPLVGDYLRDKGSKFDVIYIIGLKVAESLLLYARMFAPSARIIFHAPDLQFLREMRGAELNGDPDAITLAERTKSRELAVLSAADHVVLVSPAEIIFLPDTISRDKISVFPALYSPITVNPKEYEARKDIFFIGNFSHRPNVGAVCWFVERVWPAIHKALPEAEFHIIGAKETAEVKALGQQPGVRFLGYVKDLEPVLSRYRLSVAPLLYGAGIKGKLGTAMGAGVPAVATTIAAEGMNIIDGVHALVRDDASAFSEAVIKLYTDKALWTRISCDGQGLVAEKFGDAANRRAFLQVLERAKSLPLDLYIKYCQKATPVAVPTSTDPDVSIIIPVYNQWSLTQTCLNSVISAAQGCNIPYEVILADDGSTDDTQKASIIFPGLRVVRQQINVGFIANCNAAAYTARGKYLLFLKNDTVVLPGWLTELVRLLEKEPSAAIVGSKLLYPDGTIQEAGAVLYSDATASSLGRGVPWNSPLHSSDREVDYITGVSILVRRSFWATVGGFDARFKLAYCEDCDLAMNARSLGMKVMLASKSQVIHFEHGIYGEQAASTSKILANRNIKALRKKWLFQLANQHLPALTPIDIASAYTERTASIEVQSRRRRGQLNILFFSPYPSHPGSHGNRATIQSFGRALQRLGHRVHFALLNGSYVDENALEEMRATWDSLDILPNDSSFSAEGVNIPFDGWYQIGLGENVRLLLEKYEIDVVLCSYVFQSKLLDYVPSHILKIIDTHDKMGNRYDMLRANGQPLEFFSCSPEDEGAYLRRADVVVARRLEEAQYFDEVSGLNTAIVIPHFEDARFLYKPFRSLHKIGIVASANRINLILLHDFLNEIALRCGETCPFIVEVAGEVKNMVSQLSPEQRAVFAKPWVKLRGFVPDIMAFYQDVDLVVSPVTMGTGINVKTVQAMAFGMPLLTTRIGIKGIETHEPLHCHETLTDLVTSLFDLMEKPEELSRLAELSINHYRKFKESADISMQNIFQNSKLFMP